MSGVPGVAPGHVLVGGYEVDGDVQDGPRLVAADITRVGPQEPLQFLQVAHWCSEPGFLPDDVASAPPTAVARLAEQLRVDPEEIRSYGRRAKTRTDHLRHDSPTWLFWPVIHITGLNSPLTNPGTVDCSSKSGRQAATREWRFFEVSRRRHLAWLADQATGPAEK